MHLINIAILTLLLVISLVVLVRKNKKITDYLLFSILLSIACYIASDIWVHITLNHGSFALHSIAGYLPFPPILFFGLLLISKEHRIKKSWWWLLVFHFSYYLFIIGDLYIWNNYSTEDIERLYVSPPWPYHFYYKGLHIYMIVVLLWFMRRLKNYQVKIHDYYSNIDGVDLTWFKHFLWVYISVYSTSFTAMILLNLDILDNIEYAFTTIGISILLSLTWMIYHGLRQYSLANFSEAVTDSAKSSKYATSSLSKEKSGRVFEKIESLFGNEKVFLNPELKVQDVAKQLEVTNHNISQAINETAGMSFYDFVNEHRLKHFQSLLADPEKAQYTILALGMDSGFNSKASMNRIFKKHLGETPRQYQQRMLA